MKKCLFILFLLVNVKTYTQDLIFSQNFLVPETLNTSFSGANRASKLGSMHRSQWRNFGVKTNTSFVYVDTWLEGFKTGVGVTFLNHTENAAGYSFNQLNLNLAMAFQINEFWFFRPSISTGFGLKSYGFQNLLLEDQINIGTNSFNLISGDPRLFSDKREFVDLSSSLLFNNQNSWVGVTLRHLNRPNISITENGNAPLEIFMSVHAKLDVNVFEKYSYHEDREHQYYFLANFMKQSKYNRFDFGGQYVFKNRFSFGALAATSPLKNDLGESLFTSVSAFAGIKWQGFRFGYSFDTNTNKIQRTGGIHEFSISYDFSVNLRLIDRFKCVSYF